MIVIISGSPRIPWFININLTRSIISISFIRMGHNRLVADDFNFNLNLRRFECTFERCIALIKKVAGQ